jgi:hypothetical protein
MRGLIYLLIGVAVTFGCSENELLQATDKTPISKSETISEIIIAAFSSDTHLTFTYKTDHTVAITFKPGKGNVDARLQFNEKNEILEMISGRERMQYLYDDERRCFGILLGNGQSQVMFDYEGDNRVAQYTLRGNDTVARYHYDYANGQPKTVTIEGKNNYFRKYDLTYSNYDNDVSGFYEMVFPSDITSQLGIPALYGKKYLSKAIRTDEKADQHPKLTQNYIPKHDTIQFEVVKSSEETWISLTSDGTRNWSVKLR